MCAHVEKSERSFVYWTSVQEPYIAQVYQCFEIWARSVCTVTLTIINNLDPNMYTHRKFTWVASRGKGRQSL